MEYKSLGTGYLYKIVEGRFAEIPGAVVMDIHGTIYFKAHNNEGKTTNPFILCAKEGIMYMGMLWSCS